MTSLVDFCETDKQRAVVEAYERLGSSLKAGKELGMCDSNVRRSLLRTKARAAQRGWSPDHDMTHPVPDPFMVKRHSVNYVDGKLKQEWVIKEQRFEKALELLKQAAEAYVADLPRLKPRHKMPKMVEDDLLTFYPIADLHLGMYAWYQETGTNYDVRIARNDLCSSMDYLVGRSPPSGRAVIASLGDFFHADNLLGITERSGHVLQMDGRMSKVIDVGIAAFRQCVETALDRHKEVEIIGVPGNHDEILSVAMSSMMRNIYEREPRVFVNEGRAERKYTRHGKCLLGVVHGHKTKDSELPGIMATERPKDWGATEYRYFFRGHHHHDDRREYNGCIVEQVRTIAGRDAHAAGGGWLSRQDMKAIILDREFGEVDRQTCSLALARKMARNALDAA